MEKELCNCGRTATWLYMPSSKSLPFYCEECVPRGCSCNDEYPEDYSSREEWLHEGLSNATKFMKGETEVSPDEAEYFRYVDENGRENPCCEFDYDPEGFETE